MIRWGFLGAGWIAAKALAPAVATAPNATLYAVASRDLERSRSFNPHKVHNSYDELISDPDVDAIYISLANHQHCEWTIKALNSGKHVLCEKPLAMNQLEAQEMAAAAQRNNRLLVEAVWTRWHPRFARAINLVKAGEIGELRSIESTFTFKGSLQDNYRLDPTMGGGSLLDLGPYLVHSWLAFGSRLPQLRIDSIDKNIGATGVDLTTRISAELDNGVKLSGLASFELEGEQRLLLTGETGSIEFLGNEAFTSWNQSSSLRINNREEMFAPIDAYAVMVESFGKQINGEQAWVLPLGESIAAMGILDALSSPINPE